MSFEHRDLARLQIVVGKLGEDLALEGIDEADAEDVVADLRDALVGGRGRDHRNLIFLRHRRGGQRPAAGDLAEHRHDLVLRDQFRDGVGRLFRPALIVFDEQPDLPAAEQPAGVVDLFNRELRALDRRLPERGAVSGQRPVHADQDFARRALLGGAGPALAARREGDRRNADEASQ